MFKTLHISENFIESICLKSLNRFSKIYVDITLQFLKWQSKNYPTDIFSKTTNNISKIFYYSFTNNLSHWFCL